MGNYGQKLCCDQKSNQKIAEFSQIVEKKSEKLSTSRRTNNESPIFLVQQSAQQFCKKYQISQFYVPLISRIMIYEHEQEFEEKWNTINESQKSHFLDQLNDIKLDLMDDLFHQFVNNKERSTKLAMKFQNSFPPETISYEDIPEQIKQQIQDKGKEAILQGKVALVLMCAGSSSRYGACDKFLDFVEGEKTVMEIIFSKIHQNLQNTSKISIIVHCNSMNIEKIQKFFNQHNYFEIPRSFFHFTCSTSFIVLDSQKNYCMNEYFCPIKRAPGTAQAAEQLFSSNVYEFLKKDEIEYIYFSGMENSLENPLDPFLIGKLIVQNKQIAIKCTQNEGNSEDFPRFIRNLDEQQKINLISAEQIQFMPKQLNQVLPIALNSLAINFNTLEKVVENQQKELSSVDNYQMIKKNESSYSYINNQMQICEGYSFERDIRKYIFYVQNPVLIQVNYKENYLPIATKQKSNQNDK